MTPAVRIHERNGIRASARLNSARLLGAFVVGAIALGGCATAAEGEPEPVETSSGPITQPTEGPVSPEPTDVLFTVTATVRATDGTEIEVRLVAHEPRVWNDPEFTEPAAQFLERCATGTGVTPIDADYLTENGATLMLIDFESDSPDYQFASPIQLHFGNQYFPRAAFTDAVVTANDDAACYAGATWVFSNSAYAISAFETGTRTPDRTQWQFGSYGFQLLPDAGTTIESCEKQITELGIATGVGTVSGWDVTRDDGPSACGIGYIEDQDD